MTNRSALFCLVLGLASLPLSTPSAAASHYHVQEINLPTDQIYAAARLNNRRQVLVERFPEIGRTEPLIWQAGELTPLGLPTGFQQVNVSDFNDSGHVSGEGVYPVPGTNYAVSHPLLWRDGTITDLTPQALQRDTALHGYQIDDLDQVSGDGSLPQGPNQRYDGAFLFTVQGMTEIGGIEYADGQSMKIGGLPSSSDGALVCAIVDSLSINNSGDVAATGYMVHANCATDCSDHNEIAVRISGIWSLLPIPAGYHDSQISGWPYHVSNDQGWVAGWAYTPDRRSAFLWRNGDYVDLGADGNPVRLTNRGEVLLSTGEHQTFVWSDDALHDISKLVPSQYADLSLYDINDHGEMLASWYPSPSSQAHYILLLPGGIPGDTNGDGDVDAADVVADAEAGAGLGSPEDVEAGDVGPSPSGDPRGYGDGKVDLQDAVRLARHLDGLDNGAPWSS